MVDFLTLKFMTKKFFLAKIGAAAAAVFILSPVHAADGDEALFGLRWGMTAAEIRSVGVTLNKTSGERNFEIYTTKSVPKTLSDFESYSMIFADGKLVKIWGVSQNLINDPAGIKSKERFENLRAALTEKYGKPTHNYQKIGMKLYKEYDEFYQCLAYAGCGIWGSSFETPDKSITIEIKGLQRGVGYIDVTAEAKPQFDLSLGVYKSRGAKSDKDAI